DGLVRYDRGRGWSWPMRHVDIDGDNWLGALINTNIALDYADWRAAIVFARNGDAWQIGFSDGKTAELPRSRAAMPVRAVKACARSSLPA
ncbi:hypothetical protein, partial [Clostridium perfringens]